MFTRFALTVLADGPTRKGIRSDGKIETQERNLDPHQPSCVAIPVSIMRK